MDYDTLLGWVKRFQLEGEQGLSLRYYHSGRRPGHEEVCAHAQTLRRAHPAWGCSYIRLQLLKEHAPEAVPSVRHLQRWLSAHGLMQCSTRLPTVPDARAAKPLARVQVEAKEQVVYGDGQACCYLNFTDEHSGAILDAFVFPLCPHQPSARGASV